MITLPFDLIDLKLIRSYLYKVEVLPEDKQRIDDINHQLTVSIYRKEGEDNIGKKLKRNALKCGKCDDIIESKYTHDFKFCKCGAVAVDGGLSYTRRVGDFMNAIEMCEYE